MVSYRLLAMAGLAASVPLNINLGAYSPALVVGDGEISFGGAAAGTAAGAAAVAPAGAAPAQAAAAAVPASAAVPPASAEPGLSQQAQQIAALQGMGKEIAPRVQAVNAPNLAKRDIAGFDRALRYAEAALTKGPRVQLGTGKAGSGVGIVVDNTPPAARAGAAEGAAVVAQAKRDVDESSAPKQRRAKVTTMYVRRGVPTSLQGASEEIVARDAVVAPVVPGAAVSSAPLSRRDAIDAVNLNVGGDQGVTMTFVETVGDEGEED